MGVNTIETVGFIGLGTMGLPMAINLVDAGFHVKGRSSNKERHQRFIEAGGDPAVSITDTIENADVVITMVPDGHVLTEVISNNLQTLKPGTLVVDMSTTDPSHAQFVAEKLAQSAACGRSPAGLAL